MKIGIVGVGQVGSACALAATMGGVAREIVLVDRTRERAKAVATDVRYGIPLVRHTDIRDGDYPDLAAAHVVMITAGVNEKAGGATDRSDPKGRLKLLATNAGVYREIVPRIAKAAPDAVLLVVTDPPDPLADVAREIVKNDRVVSTGTWLDSQRFRVHLATHLGVAPASVEAHVLGEHGTSSVFVWSGARVAGVPVADALAQRGLKPEALREQIEREVRYANIAIIEGNGASIYGIGMVSARISEAILRNEGLVVPIGAFNRRFGVTLSLPGIIGRTGVSQILEPPLSNDERKQLEESAETLKEALASLH